MKKIILLIICLILCGCNDYAELNKLSLVTAAAIDKNKDKYEVTLLIANSPKQDTSAKEGEAKTTVYKAKGKTVSDAIKTIDKKTPKELYFAHINVVVISEEIGKEGSFAGGSGQHRRKADLLRDQCAAGNTHHRKCEGRQSNPKPVRESLCGTGEL